MARAAAAAPADVADVAGLAGDVVQADKAARAVKGGVARAEVAQDVATVSHAIARVDAETAAVSSSRTLLRSIASRRS